MKTAKAAALAVCLILLTNTLRAQSEDVMKTDIDGVTCKADARFGAVRDTYTRCDLSRLVSESGKREDWEKRKSHLREQILAAAGLVPMPEKTPLNARLFGRIEREDYTIEKVCFESLPGFFVTGNLYKPKGNGPFPAVLNPHGHWSHGRLENSDDCSVPGRCINFAKQGYIAFAYDMVGKSDSKLQIGHDISGRRERLWGISLGGLQLWNGIRAIDFLQSLPDVDKDRIACTGASGGGTQTFLISAVDDRVRVCAPVNMVSAHMQGGCQCENMPNLRIDTNNVEIAALMAARPMLMVSATGDWTDETPHVEFPAVKHFYEICGAADRVRCVQMKAGHNYNQDSREAVYSWFGRFLPAKPLPQPVREKPFEVEKPEDMLVFPDGKLPEKAVDRATLVEYLISRSEKQLAEHKPVDSRSLAKLRKGYLPAYREALAVTEPTDVAAEVVDETETGGYHVKRLVIRETTRGAAIPAVLFSPKGTASASPVLLVHGKGKRPLMDRSGTGPGEVMEGLLNQGHPVLVIDCFGTGEHSAPESAPKRNVDEAFFDTYNRTDMSERVFDILTALSYLWKSHPKGNVGLAGFGRAGLWCLLARPFATCVGRTVVDVSGLDTSDDQALLDDHLYVPCLRRAGDFRMAQALSAPGPLFIHNTQGKFDTSWARAAYAAARDPEALRVDDGLAADTEIVRWFGALNR